jgi:hypothetical protein
MKLFPNPADGQVELKLTLPEEQPEALTITIKNTLGETIRTIRMTSGPNGNHSFPIGLNGLPGGVYFFEISLDDEVAAVKKLVKR